MSYDGQTCNGLCPHNTLLIQPGPSYYTWHPVCECKDIVQHFPYHIGNAIAYLWRAGKKGSAQEDLKKAITHIQFEIDRLSKLSQT